LGLICGLAAMVALTACARKPTVDDAKKFLDEVEQKTLDLGNEAQEAGWVQENFITDDTEALSAKASQRAIDYGVLAAKESKKFDDVQLPADMRRKMTLGDQCVKRVLLR